ncbi:hypothetical protein AB0F91_04905 [Amycolatopsis sp. NPDC023774]|uniref:hypothetical protein n=1 Tax=Amycolatopsis sp. NPDC023774 TaxID=3155015 RepID=UPI00340D5AB2
MYSSAPSLRAQLFLAATAVDRDGAEAHLFGEPGGQVADAAHALHGDEIAGAGLGVAQRIDGGDAGTHAR